MQLEGYFAELSPDDIRLKGHRIGIETILYEYVHRGLSPEAIVAAFDTLTIEEVYATILFYHRERERLDAYLDRWLTQQDAARRLQQADPVVLESRRRLADVRAQLAQSRHPVGALSTAQ